MADAGIASLHYDTGTVEIDCPYNEDFISDLKAAIPSYARQWNGARKVWIVAGEFWDQAEEVVLRYFTITE
jgi:hypothetical protein